MGVRNPGWIRAMGLIHGGLRHWLDRGDGIDLWGCATLVGTGRWHWFTGTRHGGAQLDWGDGIDLWGHAMGCNTRWMWVMGLSYGGMPWGRATGSGRWIWFVGERHGGAQHWLDLGDGIDLCGHVMGARDTGWIGPMGLMTNYYMVAEFKWRYHVSSCLALR